MTRRRALEVNRKIEVIVKKENKVFKSMIQAVNEVSFTIGIPFKCLDTLLLRPGSVVKIRIISENEQFVFSSKVVKKQTFPLPAYVLEVPRQVKRIQLREFVRLKTVLEAELMPLEEGSSPAPESQKILVTDISGGGVAIALEDKLAEKSLGRIRFVLTIDAQKHEFIFKAEVRRCERNLSERPKYLAGLVFVDITEKERDLIIRYIFQKMREQRRLEK